MMSQYNRNSKKRCHYAVNACLAPLYSVEGMHVITVEGIGNRPQGLHPVQELMARAHGSQCGFCTPGFIMSMYALLRSSETSPSEEQMEECLSGNLCRCTGYRPILDAFCVFSKINDSLYGPEMSSLPAEGSNFVCFSTGRPCSCQSKENSPCLKKYEPISYSDIDGKLFLEKELIFPTEFLLRKPTYLYLKGNNGLKWHRPLQLKQLLELKSRYLDANLLGGNTEIGIETRLKHYPVLISTTHIPELNMLNVKDDGIEIGASVRLSNLLSVLKKIVKERASSKTSGCKTLIEQLKWFAGTQIKNVASVDGNICTASPISDLNTLWMASQAKFRIVDLKGNIRVVLAENFFLGYRKADLASGEILLSIFLPLARPLEHVKEFKQAYRRGDDIAIVNAGMCVFLEEKRVDLVVADASIVYGGVAPLSVAKKDNAVPDGKSLESGAFVGALKYLASDITVKDDAPGGMVEFRRSLISSFFFKFFL